MYKHILHCLLLCDSSHICKMCCHVFAHYYTLHGNLEHPMNYELSLIPNVFSHVCPILVMTLQPPYLPLLNFVTYPFESSYLNLSVS